MKHLSHAAVGPGGTVPDEWLPVSAAVSRWSRAVAGRGDIVAAVAPGAAAGTGAPAAFFPTLAELHIDASVCLPPGTRPGTVDIEDPLWRLENLRFTGPVLHEAGHARHTRWTPGLLVAAGAGPGAVTAVELLEEPRVERLIGALRREHALLLRGSAVDFVLSEHEPAADRAGAAAAAALLLARADAGIIGHGDVAAVRSEVLKVLGPSDLGELERLWQRFIMLGDRDIPGMVAVGQAWADVVGPSSSEASTDPGTLAAAIGTAAVRADAAVVGKRGELRSKRSQERAAAAAERRAQGRQQRRKAFDPGGSGSSEHESTAPPESRPATRQEHRAATALAELLTRAADPEGSVERFDRPLPPGRMNARAAMQEEALRAVGDDREVDLFSGTVRVPGPQARLTVAMMSDVSGSMRPGAEAMASCRWVVARAATAVGGTVAEVLFGNRARGILRAHRITGTVDVHPCLDGTEDFKDGFLAVTAETELLEATGARLLVIASDAKYGRAVQAEYARTAMGLCREAGIGVLWLDFTGSFRTTYGHGTVVPARGLRPVEVAEIVGRVVVEELEACMAS